MGTTDRLGAGPGVRITHQVHRLPDRPDHETWLVQPDDVPVLLDEHQT